MKENLKKIKVKAKKEKKTNKVGNKNSIEKTRKRIFGFFNLEVKTICLG